MAAAAVNQRASYSCGDGGQFEIPTVSARDVSPSERVPTTTPEVEIDSFNMYRDDKLRDAVAHANEITQTYGVEIISINIISAIPKDKNLQASLAKGAVAAAEAQMMETSAQGKSRAMQIEAAAKAKQTMIVAQADADAEILRAEGSKKAADLLSTNAVSVELAKIDRTGTALAGNGNNSSFFFGADSQHWSSLLSNNGVVSTENK